MNGTQPEERRSSSSCREWLLWCHPHGRSVVMFLCSGGIENNVSRMLIPKSISGWWLDRWDCKQWFCLVFSFAHMDLRKFEILFSIREGNQTKQRVVWWTLGMRGKNKPEKERQDELRILALSLLIMVKPKLPSYIKWAIPVSSYIARLCVVGYGTTLQYGSIVLKYTSNTTQR